MNDVVATLLPVLDALVGLDLAAREPAEAILRQRLPEAVLAPIRDALRDAHETTSLTPKQAGERLSFGRLAKPSDATRGFSIDVVDMQDVAGAVHTHPTGEVSLLVPLSGAPTFEGASGGLVVQPAGSRHVPTVAGGRMLIVYFLPEGAMVWG